MTRAVFISLALGVCTVLSGCDDTTETIGERLPSPDGKVEAVRVDREAGATVSDSVYIYVVPSGAKMSDFGAPSIRVDKYSGIKMKWKANRDLLVTYTEAQVFESNKTWSSPFVDFNRHEVAISLQEKP